MKKNMSDLDKGLRLLVAAIFAIAYFLEFVSGTFGIIILVLAIVFAATSFIGFCPLYTLFGFSTCKTKKPHHPPPHTAKKHRK